MPERRRSPASRQQRGRTRTRRDNALSQMLATPTGRAMLAVSMRAEITAADAVAPPGTVIETVVHALRRHTDLAPLLGVGMVMAMASAALSQAGATVRWPGESRDIELALWLVMLAPSGQGKTLLRKAVADAMGLRLTTLPDPASGPAYLDAMRDAGGRCLWRRDEYGQLIRSMAQGGSREDMRDLLLRTYDHDELVHATRTRGETRVPHPVLTILGTSVDTTWGDCVDAQMLSDGFAARHLYLVTESGPMSVPRYPEQMLMDAIRSGVAAGDVAERLSRPLTYEITQEADAVYHDLWHELVADLGQSLDAAYIRRITWAAARYSVIYHVLLGRDGNRVGVHAMRWAWRMVMLHCYCARLVLGLADRSLAGRVERIAAWVEAQRDAGVDVRAPGFARRVIQRFRRDLHNIHEARQIVALVTA